MQIGIDKYSKFLEQVARDLDIPPSKYRDAVNRYNAVGKWLEDGAYPGCLSEPSIYPQGSFRLGTVVRPIRGGVEAEYDIDLVCELALHKRQTDPRSVKFMVGDRLRARQVYKRLLDEEGRRCWTLQYAEEDGVGFHIDVLPAVSDSSYARNTAIAITNKHGDEYSWSSSDPRGYGIWFDGKNAAAFARAVLTEKRLIQQSVPHIYASIDDVPNELVRTPLQRAIQLQKRHRDIRFSQSPHSQYAPISIILTTLSAELYENEADVYSALAGIVHRLTSHIGLLEGRDIDPQWRARGLIRRTPDGRWYIGNPVNPAENFADRWHEDNHARARAFFSWVAVLHRDLVDLPHRWRSLNLREHLAGALGAAPVSRNISILLPPVSSPPRITIASPPKPWRA